MSNSPLVAYTKISPNKSSPRNAKIDTITIHCVVGQCTAETLGQIFAPTSRQASSNYGVDKDGRIGMYVEEKDRSWCTSSSANDNRAITIEVASDTTHPYAVNAKALAATIELCADICRRNGIKKLLWKGDKNLIGQPDKQNMTVHRWFANKSCPGDYLYERHGYIADEVNKLLGATSTQPATPTQPTSSNDEIAWNFFVSKGLTAEGTAGLLGNLYAESGIIPNNLQNTYEKSLGLNDAQYTAGVDNGTYKNFVNDKAGYGIAQWTYYTRKQALLDFAKAAKASIGSLDMQLDFLWKELQGYPTVVSTLKTAKTVREASNIVLFQFERPADQGVAVQTQRTSYGMTYNDKFSSKTVVSIQPDINEVYQVNVNSSLNCRSGAGTTHSIVGSFKPKEIVTASKKSGSWLYVTNGKITGWASGDYLVQLTVKGAIDKLVKEGIVNSPDVWIANSTKMNYLDRLIINMGYADKTSKEGTRITTAEQAIDKMVSCGIISSPDYWKANYKNIAWLDVFLIKVANRL